MQNDEEKRRQSGPGLIVIDRYIEEESPSADDFYVSEDGQKCKLVTGTSISNFDSVCGKVLFLCRPPARSAAARLNSYAIMSV